MKKAAQLNNWIANNIPFLILAALIAGLLFPTQLGVFSPYVGYMMIFQTFANSLGGGFRDLAQVMAHPKPVLLTMLTLHVLMPVIALGAGVLIFPQNPLYTLSLVLVESSPAAVSSLIWMTIGGGSTGICLSTVLLDPPALPVDSAADAAAAVRHHGGAGHVGAHQKSDGHGGDPCRGSYVPVPRLGQGALFPPENTISFAFQAGTAADRQRQRHPLR